MSNKYLEKVAQIQKRASMSDEEINSSINRQLLGSIAGGAAGALVGAKFKHRAAPALGSIAGELSGNRTAYMYNQHSLNKKKKNA